MAKQQKHKKNKSATKPSKSTKKSVNKSGRRCNAKAASAFKGTIIRVSRNHGILRDDRRQTEYFISGRDLLGAVPGDIVLFELRRASAVPSGDNLPEAKIVQILRESKGVLTGTLVLRCPDEYAETSSERLCVAPDSFGAKYPLETRKLPDDAKAGDKVSFVIKKRGDRHHYHVVEVVDVYGSTLGSGSAKVCVNAYLDEKEFALKFSDEAEAEAARCGSEIDTAEIPKRLDLRELPIFTIDGADTKDIDDAVSIEKFDSGGYRLGVHIADVSHYVRVGSTLDSEAYERGTSVYIADLVIPMLPKSLSNGICSLNPNVERLAFSCIMDVGKDGELKAFEFKKTVIRSRLQGVYSEINAILSGSKEFDDKYKEVLSQIPIMNELAGILKQNRIKRHAPSLDSPECKIICDDDGKCLDILKRECGKNAIAEGIIEEFMLLANNAAARLAMKNEIPFVYRVHEQPTVEKLMRLTQSLAGLGISGGELEPTAECLTRILNSAINNNPDKAQVVSMAVLRAMMKAKYSEEPLGHFGLVMNEYAHFTSPIRRYPDLAIHRILSDYYCCNRDTRRSFGKLYGKFVHDCSLKSSNAEVKAVNAERDCNRFYFAEYMTERIGQQFEGLVSGITDSSLFVLLDNMVEGRVSFRGEYVGKDGVLSENRFVSDGVNLSNAVTGAKFTLGDRVRVKCISCSVPLGNVDFELT